MNLKNDKYISARLKFITTLWLSFPLSFLVLCIALFQTGLGGVAKAVLSPWFWVVSGIAMWGGYSVRSLKWYGWYVFVLSSILINYEAAWALAYLSGSEYRALTFVGLTLFQVATLFIVGQEIRVPYFSPRIRWWESDPRFKFSVQVKLKPLTAAEDQPAHDAEIVDISRGGCFVKTNAPPELDERLDLEFTLFQKPLRCEGLVVWKTESTVTHPKGVGVRFVTLDRETITALKESTHTLKGMALTYREMVRNRNWEDYLAREKKFQEHLNSTKKES